MYSMLKGLVKAEEMEEGVLKKETKVTSSTVLLLWRNWESYSRTCPLCTGYKTHGDRATAYKWLCHSHNSRSGKGFAKGWHTTQDISKNWTAVFTKITLRPSYVRWTFPHISCSRSSCKLKWTENSDQERHIHAIILAVLWNNNANSSCYIFRYRCQPVCWIIRRHTWSTELYEYTFTNQQPSDDYLQSTDHSIIPIHQTASVPGKHMVRPIWNYISYIFIIVSSQPTSAATERAF